MVVTEGIFSEAAGSVVDSIRLREVVEGSSDDKGRLRLREASFARRTLRSVAAASSEACVEVMFPKNDSGCRSQ